MKKFYSLLVLSLVFIVACESSGENESSDDKKKEITINQPPSGDYFIGIQQGESSHESQPVWTTDYITYTQLTDEFEDGVAKLWLDNDTIVLQGFQNINGDGKYNLYFASINDLKNFITIKSIYQVNYAAVINGVVVAYSEFGHTGSCQVGSTEITWQSKLPTGTEIRAPFRVSRGELIAQATINGSDGYALTKDNGLTWSFNLAAYGNGDIELIDGKSWSVDDTSWGYITSNDFANGVWTSDSFNAFLEGNTTNISGQFNVSGAKMVMHTNDWRIYGYIEKDSANMLFHYPAVNKSTNNGLTWTTSLLTGVTADPDNIQSKVHTTSSLTIVEYSIDGTHIPEFYSSTNGIAFTKMTYSNELANNLNSAWQYIR